MHTIRVRLVQFFEWLSWKLGDVARSLDYDASSATAEDEYAKWVRRDWDYKEGAR